MSASEQHWVTSAQAPARALDEFREILAKTHFTWDLARDAPQEPFKADVRRRVFDGVVFTEIECAPCEGTRGAPQINTASDAYICLAMMERGRQFFSHGDTCADFAQGDMLLWDAVRPGHFVGVNDVKCLTVLFPRAQIARYVADIDDLCARKINGKSGAGFLLHSHLQALHSTIDEIDERERPAVLHSTLELVAACFRPEHNLPGRSAYQKALLRRVQDYVLEHLGDADVSPARVAAHFKFSTRYMHQLFESSEQTFSEWVRAQKLERARRMLSDQQFKHESITSIAFRLGFSSSEHFSRAFRSRFEMSPSECRTDAGVHTPARLLSPPEQKD